MNCLFSKDSLQCVFSREGIQPDRSKLQETGKRSTPKNAKNIWIFLTMLNDFHKTIVNYSKLKHSYTPVKRTLTKGKRFWLDWNLQRSFWKLKLCANSDICHSYFDESLRVSFTPAPPRMEYLDHTFTKKIRPRRLRNCILLFKLINPDRSRISQHSLSL